MRDPERIDKTLEELKKIWKKYPDLRLGQLILNAAKDPALYYLEDKQLIEILKEVYNG